MSYGASPAEIRRQMNRYQQEEEDLWKELNKLIEGKEPDREGTAHQNRKGGKEVTTKIWVLEYTSLCAGKGKMTVTKYYTMGNTHINSEKYFTPDKE